MLKNTERRVFINRLSYVLFGSEVVAEKPQTIDGRCNLPRQLRICRFWGVKSRRTAHLIQVIRFGPLRVVREPTVLPGWALSVPGVECATRAETNISATKSKQTKRKQSQLRIASLYVARGSLQTTVTLFLHTHVRNVRYTRASKSCQLGHILVK